MSFYIITVLKFRQAALTLCCQNAVSLIMTDCLAGQNKNIHIYGIYIHCQNVSGNTEIFYLVTRSNIYIWYPRLKTGMVSIYRIMGLKNGTFSCHMCIHHVRICWWEHMIRSDTHYHFKSSRNMWFITAVNKWTYGILKYQRLITLFVIVCIIMNPVKERFWGTLA